MKNQFIIGGIEFATKKEILSYCKFSLQKALCCFDRRLDCAKFWEELLFMSRYDWHRQITEKIKTVGILNVKAEKRDNGYGVLYVSKNGIEIPIGYKKCINAPTPLSILSSVFREIVRPDIITFRDMQVQHIGKNSIIQCPITGQYVHIDKTHIDHVVPTFESISKEFILLHKIDVRNIKYKFLVFLEQKRIKKERVFSGSSQWMAKAFKDFHAKKTDIHNPKTKHLRLTSPTGNMRRLHFEKSA